MVGLRHPRTGVALLAMALLCRTTQARDAAVRERAEVYGARILLSDLIDDAEPSLKAVARAIDLGRSPQPGSQRVLPGEQIARRLSCETRFHSLAVPEHIIVRNPGWEISREALWSALVGYMLQAGYSDEQLPDVSALHWPDSIRAVQAEAPLRITRTEWISARQTLQIYARCAEAAVCGSFLAQAFLRNSLPEDRRAQAMAGIGAGNKRAQALPAPPLLNAGKRVTLILESGGMRIRLPAIALERGAMGQKIRVREWKGQRVYQAEVIAAQVLRATLK